MGKTTATYFHCGKFNHNVFRKTATAETYFHHWKFFQHEYIKHGYVMYTYIETWTYFVMYINTSSNNSPSHQTRHQRGLAFLSLVEPVFANQASLPFQAAHIHSSHHLSKSPSMAGACLNPSLQPKRAGGSGKTKFDCLCTKWPWAKMVQGSNMKPPTIPMMAVNCSTLNFIALRFTPQQFSKPSDQTPKRFSLAGGTCVC